MRFDNVDNIILGVKEKKILIIYFNNHKYLYIIKIKIISKIN